MPIYTKLPDHLDEVDVIIAGGGTAACVVAGRLSSLSSLSSHSQSTPLSILVIETGTNNAHLPQIIHPALFAANVAPGSTTALFYQQSQPSGPELAGRAPVVPSGGVLGGGSSINFQVYTRAQRDDLDSFAMDGWSAEELLPFMRRLETYYGPGREDVHGREGPIKVSYGPYKGAKRPRDDFLRAAERVGYPEIVDLQSLNAVGGVEKWLRYVSPEGRRQDAAHTYLHPRLEGEGQDPNLHVLTETTVARVLFDEDKRASAVEFVPNPTFQPAGAEPRTVRAKKMVVVSCGACGTPGVLERSGLGDPDVLSRAGVPVVSDLPGVGANYQDHHLLLYPYRTSLTPEETLDGVLAQRLDVAAAIANQDPILGWNGIDVSAKVRPTDKEVAGLGKEFREVWDKDFRDAPNRPLMLMGLLGAFLGDPTAVPAGQYLTAGTYTAYPYSRGHMHITGPSAITTKDPLDFATGFLTDPHNADLTASVWAYKKQREIMRRMHVYRSEIAAFHPKFPAGSAAAALELPLDAHQSPAEVAKGKVEDLVYTPEDDEAIAQFVRENLNTTWHSLGTAKMAAREDGGVVDARLTVYGVKGLKVADLSIAPVNVAANTNNTALLIGEKAADLFAMELGLI